MSLAAKALWIMERNSNEPLSLTEVARACAVSRSHLAHAFGSATGVPAMRYLRSRRLSRAAGSLAAGASDILSVALDAGYGSHEAFTRAFRDEFGMTPESVRDRGNADDLKLTPALDIEKATTGSPLRPRIEEHGAMLVVGLAEPYSFESTIGIPAQWQRFMELIDDVAYQSEEIPVGVMQAADEDGQFRYLCAVEVSRFGKIPPGFETMTIAPARYAVFEHNEHVSTIFETYNRMWNEALPDGGFVVADAPFVERHNPTFNPATGEGGLTIWVPLAAPPPATDGDALSRNLETVETYGRYAPHYAAATGTMTAKTVELLDAFVKAVPAAASILEIGSGPGWDADYLESCGLSVARTDAASSFLALQRERGKVAKKLNLVTDRVKGTYDGVLMLYVIQHIDAELTDACLSKIAGCLRPSGHVLLTYREGDGTLTEHGTASGNYHSTLRRPEAFRRQLADAGLEPKWERQLVDDEGVWQAVLARRR
jgi:AraC family transcriptional regulator